MRCGLLGQTLAHSHSPLLHSLLGDYAYTLFEKAPDQVEDFLKNSSWDGLNVTIPYKKTAYALCDSLSPIARETGNVNTLLRRRDICRLEAPGRPLLRESGLSELYRQRCALYEHFSDEAILNNGAPEDALRRLKECMV